MTGIANRNSMIRSFVFVIRARVINSVKGAGFGKVRGMDFGEAEDIKMAVSFAA
jgi:hypothetical protein